MDSDMLNNSANKNLNEILQQTQQGKVVLFLGAGASHSAGVPLGRKLAEMIKEKFPEVDQSLNNFIDICQDVLDTPPYNRNLLEEFIISKMDSLQPTMSHNIMTKYDWAAIFTTNFDDIVECAYRNNKEDRFKRCQPISSEEFHVNPIERDKVYLFKIMGTITATEESTGCMVLSRADYNNALTRRRKYLELLFDFVKNGTIVFIGYSFDDRLVLDVIDDIAGIYGKERLPWSYALFNQLDMDEKTRYKFSSRKIIPLECGFEKFFDYLNKNYKATKEKVPLEKIILKLRGYSLEIDEAEYRQYSEHFEILNEEKINQESGEKDKFFMGTNKSWGAFREDWDFKRDIYSLSRVVFGEKLALGSIKERVFDELKKHNIKDNKVLLITGMAGVGKTILLKRLAYDVYTSGEAPVVTINSARTSFDYKLLASFIESINNQFDQKIHKGEHAPPIKPIIIIDDAASLIRHVNRLKDYLTSRGRSALIIAAERKGEWDMMWKSFPFSIPKNNKYELSECLTENEKSNIIDHFYNLGYIHTKGEFWDNIIDSDFENSYFATIYSLVHPSRKPLNEIIKNQYQNLSELTQKAFQYICFFHQFDLPINLELLVRSLKCSYADFSSNVIDKDSAKVIFEEQDETGNVLYRTHHRIIAKKTIEFFFGDQEIQKEIFLEILKEAILSNRKEMEICEKLLVQHIGPHAKPQILTRDQQRQIFKSICEKNQIRSIVHHWGILEADDQNLIEAERLLKKALDIQRGDIESYGGESVQNILTSLGRLYTQMGINIIKKNETNGAQEYFEKAEDSFRHAKHGEFPNAHAYHSHAYMWYSRGNQLENEAESLDHYARSIEILSIAKDNLNKEELQYIYELETTVWAQIGDETKVTHAIETLRDNFDSARGYYLNAEMYWRRAYKKEEDERKKLLELALRKAEKGLKFFPNDENCLRLQCKLHKELNPHNLKESYNLLQKWKTTATTPNAWLLYELGRTSFILEYYDYSKAYFEELEKGVGMGHKLRSRHRDPITDDNEDKKEFEGTIANLFSLKDGTIRCETLRNLRYSIAFRPIACKFTASSGDLVRFYIEFSYRGPRAENVRKI